MKLLIDIPEEVVTAIQNGKDYRYDIHTTIAQGIPYEPKGDLISREALKKKFDDYIKANPNISAIFELGKIIIDTAPTVEAYTSEDIVKYISATEDLVREKLERPQGEWIRKVDDVGFISHICSECGAEIEVEDPKDDKFCFNCGADMRKGGAE